MDIKVERFLKLNGCKKITDKEIIIDEDRKSIIDMKLQIINDNISNNQLVTILYFEKDRRKAGGKYKEYTGYLKKIDTFEEKIVFKDKFKIDINCITDINIIQ